MLIPSYLLWNTNFNSVGSIFKERGRRGRRASTWRLRRDGFTCKFLNKHKGRITLHSVTVPYSLLDALIGFKTFPSGLPKPFWGISRTRLCCKKSSADSCSGSLSIVFKIFIRVFILGSILWFPYFPLDISQHYWVKISLGPAFRFININVKLLTFSSPCVMW